MSVRSEPRSNLILKDNDEYDPTAVHESGDEADEANDLAADEPHRSLFRQCLTDEMEALTLPMNRLGLRGRREAADALKPGMAIIGIMVLEVIR